MSVGRGLGGWVLTCEGQRGMVVRDWRGRGYDGGREKGWRGLVSYHSITSLLHNYTFKDK